MGGQLHKYWFVGSGDDPYGPTGLGVTAFTPDDAREILRQELPRHRQDNLSVWRLWKLEAIDTAQVVEDVDVRMLDQGHVIPNMGLVIDRGVWWPKTTALY